MHSISIKNFGPLVNLELHSNKFTFLIGEQASGKSTLAKLIYFFRTLQDEFVNLAFTSGSEDWQVFRKLFLSLLKRKFTGIFGGTKELGDFVLVYSYTETHYVTVKPAPDRDYLGIELSSELHKNLESILNKTQKVLSINRESAYNLYLSFLNDSKAKKDIISAMRSIFDDDAYMIYIPAGRAFLSRQALLQLIQTDEISRIRPDEQPYQYDTYDIIDAPTGNYISEVRRVREWFLSPQISERLKTNGNDAFIDYIQMLNSDILKGSYVADKYNDYIRIQGSKDVKISYASSGQQEVIWLLNLLYAFAVERRKCVVIIEEPETHLHPDAQYTLAKCIAAFSNYTDSEVVVSTHSPYVLTSFNNLIYAGKCGRSSVVHSELNDIIRSESWLDPDAFYAYVLEQGEIRNIRDDYLSMIDIADLDAVASSQDTEYEVMSSLYSEVR